jgi:hypothetical protein
MEPADQGGLTAVVQASRPDSSAQVDRHAQRGNLGARRYFPPWMSVAASFLLGAAAMLWFVHQRGIRIPAERLPDGLPLGGGQHAVLPVATLVSYTSHMWDAQAGVAMKPGSPLHAGRSVALFDGIAEVRFEGGATTRLQGPAMLSINPAGIPELKYGKLLANNSHDGTFQIDVPLASAWVAHGSVAGVDAFGDEVVIHALEGSTRIIPIDRHMEPLTVAAGTSVRLRKDARSELAAYTDAARPATFDFGSASTSSVFRIPPHYADAIKQAKPIAYWRFEHMDSQGVPNEMQQRHNLQPLGDNVRLVQSEGNGYAEFVMRQSKGCFVLHDTLDELAGGDYSVEFWMRPNHFQRGAIVSLVEQMNDERGSVERHGLIIETHAANPVLVGPEGRPKSIRFLHRSPPHELLTGTSCFSPMPYTPKTWQHVTAVKEALTMRLYVDGKLVATEDDETTLSEGLSLVVGQLFSFGTVRPFVGQLDELAIYDRALQEEEILVRVEVVQGDTR